MNIASSRQVVMKIVSDLETEEVDVDRIVEEVRRLHDADVRVYRSSMPNGIRDGIFNDIRALVILGLAEMTGDTVKLTGAGELVAMNLVYPLWAERRMTA